MDLRSLVTRSVVALLGCGCVTTPSGHDAASGRGDPRFADFQDVNFLSTKPAYQQIISAGDIITFDFNDPTQLQASIVVDSVVNQDGTITLLSNRVFMAAGKTIGKLDREVRAYYGPKFFASPSCERASYAVGGEVKSPNSYRYVGRTTVSMAIESAGGFTESAKRTNVQLNRSGHTYIINTVKAQKDPKLDMVVIPDDEIVVPHSFWRW